MYIKGQLVIKRTLRFRIEIRGFLKGPPPLKWWRSFQNHVSYQKFQNTFYLTTTLVVTVMWIRRYIELHIPRFNFEAVLHVQNWYYLKLTLACLRSLGYILISKFHLFSPILCIVYGCCTLILKIMYYESNGPVF